MDLGSKYIPEKLTWQWKNDHLKMCIYYILLKMMVFHYHHASFRDVSPMTTRTLSLFHMLCVKLSHEFTVKKDINDCCREVLQHYKSQRWFWMQTSSQNPQKRQQEIAGDLFQESEAKIPSHFQMFAHSSQRKISLVRQPLRFDGHFFAALFAAFRSFLGIPMVFFCRWYNLVR